MGSKLHYTFNKFPIMYNEALTPDDSWQEYRDDNKRSESIPERMACIFREGRSKIGVQGAGLMDKTASTLLHVEAMGQKWLS